MLTILPFFYRAELLNEFLDSAKASSSPAQAIELVKLASAFSLPVCEGLTRRVMAEFTLTQEQRYVGSTPSAWRKVIELEPTVGLLPTQMIIAFCA